MRCGTVEACSSFSDAKVHVFAHVLPLLSVVKPVHTYVCSAMLASHVDTDLLKI